MNDNVDVCSCLRMLIVLCVRPIHKHYVFFLAFVLFSLVRRRFARRRKIKHKIIAANFYYYEMVFN